MHTIASRDQQYSGTHEIYFIDLNAYTPKLLLPTYIFALHMPTAKNPRGKICKANFALSDACYCHWYPPTPPREKKGKVKSEKWKVKKECLQKLTTQLPKTENKPTRG